MKRLLFFLYHVICRHIFQTWGDLGRNALSPHSEKAQKDPAEIFLLGSFCVDFACSPVLFLREPQYHPTVQQHASEINW